MTYSNKYHYSGRAGIVGGARPKTVQQIPAKSIQIYCDENADPSVAPVQTGEWTKAPHRDHVNKENEKKAGVWNKAKVGVVSTIIELFKHYKKNEPPHGKTNNVVSEQVRHKPSCTSTEKS